MISTISITNGKLFNYSAVESIGQIPTLWDTDEIKNEPMLFSAGLGFAIANGGLLTRSFISSLIETDSFTEAINENGTNITVDSRVHMLMPGMYPCIPGWHHDDVDRPDSGQPLYIPNSYERKTHFMCLINADVSATEFIHKGCLELTDPSTLKSVYKEWDDEVYEQLLHNKVGKKQAENGIIYQFDSGTMHRGTEAVKHGWRWFIRLTVGGSRKQFDEVRNQVQVYLPTINQGW